MIIVFEGIDKSGKNTQTNLLLDVLSKAKRHVGSISFPRYDGPFGKEIKDHLYRVWSAAGPVVTDPDTDAKVFQGLMLADKATAVPLLTLCEDMGSITIVDRYWQSAYAYGAADGLDKKWLRSIHELLPRAVWNILIDTPVQVALARGRTGREDKPDRYEQNPNRLNVIRDNYLELWHQGKEETDEHWTIIDGTLGVKEIHEKVIKLITGDHSGTEERREEET